MRIIVRPGHGVTPPYPLCYPKGARTPQWMRQRPGGRNVTGWPIGRWYEDDWTAVFAARLVPALEAAGHVVVCQRALPGTPEGDAVVTVGPTELPELSPEAPSWTGPRWQLCAAVEGVLRGAIPPRSGCGWSFDPQASVRWEFASPGDLYLSIHVNYVGKEPDLPYPERLNGVTSWHYRHSKRGVARAQSLQSAIVHALTEAGGDLERWAAPGRIPIGSPQWRASVAAGARWGIYGDAQWEVRCTASPAVILELGFASHVPSDGGPSDLDLICSDAGMSTLVAGIVAGCGAA